MGEKCLELPAIARKDVPSHQRQGPLKRQAMTRNAIEFLYNSDGTGKKKRGVGCV